MTKTVFVTGGNRGIGLEIVRGYVKEGCKVLLGCRDEESGKEACADIVGGDIHVIEMGLSNEQAIIDHVVRAEAVYGPIDILINNAGTLHKEAYNELSVDDFQNALQLHVLAPFTFIKQVLPGMVERNFGRIVNVSSGWGAFNEGMEGPLAYSVSKAALNAMTVNVAGQVKEASNVKVNAMCPGWVHTRMGGKEAPKTPEQGADTAIWLGLLDEDGPSGKFFRERKEIDW